MKQTLDSACLSGLNGAGNHRKGKETHNPEKGMLNGFYRSHVDEVIPLKKIPSAIDFSWFKPG